MISQWPVLSDWLDTKGIGRATEDWCSLAACPTLGESKLEGYALRLVLAFVFAAACSAAPARADPLAAQVTKYRDDYGTRHIVGDMEEAAFFGYGYAQAEDHLEDMMMIQYRDAQGRRTEVQGIDVLGDGYLHFIPYEYRSDGDYLQRLLRTKAAVVANRQKIEAGVYRILDAFARGVNSYIAAHRNEIPAWIDSIRAEDVEALERSHYMRFIASTMPSRS